MNRSNFFACLMSALLVSACLDCAKPQDSTRVVEEMSARSRSLSGYEYTWKVKSNISEPPATQEMLARKEKNAIARAETRITEDHVTRNDLKNKYINDEKYISRSLFEGGNHSSESKLIITRIGEDASQFGSMTDPVSKIVTRSHQIYQGSNAIFYGDETSTNNNKKVNPSTPLILGAQGKAIYQMLGNGSFLNSSPLDFVFLTNSNPFMLFDSKYGLIGKNGKLLNCKFSHEFSGRTQEYLLVVNTMNNSVESCTISEKNESYLFEYKVIHTRTFNKYIIPDIVVYTRKIGDYSSTNTMILKGISPAKPILLSNIPKKMMVSDTRLRGMNLDKSGIKDAMTWENPYYLQYPWPGYFPDLSELQRISKDFHSQNPSASSSSNYGVFTLVPGVLLIATGVFLKLRKSRKEKEIATPTAKK